jgi:Ser/Thr protein kinase RdoA (MazF antagonist)
MSRALPSDVLAAVKAPKATVHRLAGRSGAWRIDEPHGSFVLRRYDPHAHPPTGATLAGDVGWVHQHLDRLAHTGFRASRPVDRLAGDRVGEFDGAVWETLTYLPGRIAGWSKRPSMGVLGGFLASYHDATDGLPTGGQRVPAYPISSVLSDVDGIARRVPVPERVAFTDACEALAAGLLAIDHKQAPRSVIHGDLTNHNVIVAGSPVGPVAAIDFANAYVEATLADVAFALWRSGRPFQAAETFDVHRIAAYVAGYHERRPLSEREAAAIVVYLRARGIQIIVKQAARHPVGPIDCGPLAKLTELARVERRLLDTITAAVA